MSTRRLLIVLAVLTATLIVVPMPSAAADQPDSCSDAPLVNANGTNSGTINSTEDVDSFRISLTEGERVEFGALVPPEQDAFDVEIEPGDEMAVTHKNVSNANWYSTGYPSYRDGVDDFTGGLEGTWELWAEKTGTVCVSVSDPTGDTPYDWEVTMETSSPSEPDQWADSASDAQLVDTNGTYTGVLNTPDDADTLKLRLDEGDHLDLGALVPPAQDAFDVEIEPEDGMSVSYKNVSNADRYSTGYPSYRDGVDEFTGGLEGTWELWAEESGVITVTLTDPSRDATVPYEWQLSTEETPPAHTDTWSDSSSDADLVDTNGTYSGYITTPDDVDKLKFRLDEGDHLNLSALVPPAQDAFDVEIEPEDKMAVSYKNVSNADRYSTGYPSYRDGVDEFTGGLEGTWELWAEESGVVTVTLSDPSRSATVPYEWQLSTEETPAPYSDDYPDSYSDANRVDANGTYQGRITTPQDTDAISVLLEEGDTLYVQTTVPPAQSSFSVSIEELNTASVSLEAVTNADKYSTGYPSYDTGIDDFTGSVPATYELHAESSGAVALTVSDSASAAVPYTWSTTLSKNEPIERNTAPSASIVVDPEQPTIGESVTFDGTNSTDADGQVVKYQWDFNGDGETDATGETATHTYSSAGTYSATLTVTDDEGATDTVTESITVESGDQDTAGVGIELRPTAAEVATNSTHTVSVVATNVTDGIGSYDATVELNNTTVATIADVTLNGNPLQGGSTNITADGSSVSFDASAADTEDTGSVTIASLTLETQSPGVVGTTTTVDTIGNESGTSLSVTGISEATMTVTGEGDLPAVVGDRRPTDTDGDGAFEDVNGDGSFDVNDVTALWANRNSNAVQNNPTRFDSNGDGSFDVNDVTTLWNDYLTN